MAPFPPWDRIEALIFDPDAPRRLVVGNLERNDIPSRYPWPRGPGRVTPGQERNAPPIVPHARRQRLIVAIATVTVLTIAGGVWLSRWRLSHTAVTIAGPLVRAWVASQVASASDSAYRLETSTIRVDEANRRVAIDSITLTTDSLVNARLAIPHPSITLSLRRCAVTGIDLIALAARRGLHALHGGCDSVSLQVRTLAAPPGPAGQPPQGADSNNFLRFQGKLDLPALLPLVVLDSVTFPHVHAAFDLLAADGRRTKLSVDSVAVSLDSVRIDPRLPVARRRPLFSRDIHVRLDRFAVTTKTAEHVSLDHFDADLVDGSAHLDEVAYQRAAGTGIDSTGAMSVQARHVALAGVRWRIFLLTGDIAIDSLQVDSVDIRITAPRRPRTRAPPALPGSIASALRSAGRAIDVAHFGVRAMRMEESGRTSAGLAVTTIDRLTLSHLDVLPGPAAWQRPLPIGPVVLTASSAFRHTPGMDLALGHLALDAGAGTLTLDSLRAAPPGDDSAFERRQRYRRTRTSLAAAEATLRGIDLPAFLTRGALRARSLDIRGLALDVLNDKHLPQRTVRPRHRSPQEWLRHADIESRLDTLTATGQITYRERDDNAAHAGVLSFTNLRLRGVDFSTDSRSPNGTGPFHLVADARLMGAGALHVEWNVPLLARDFEMTWKGSLGAMRLPAMNAFLPDAVGTRFAAGRLEGAEWRVTVRNGVARGTLAPRWRGLKVGLPGVARNNSSVVGGVMRGVAKLVANTFTIRSDNVSSPGDPALVGTITHQWTRDESLPDFIWHQLRDPLLLILKK